VFWFSVPSLVVLYELSIGFAFVLGSAQCLTVLLAVRLPKTALGLHLAGLFSTAFVTRGSIDQFWPVSVYGLLALTGLLVVLGLRERWPLAVAGWWLSFLVLVLAVILFAGTRRSTGDWGLVLLTTVTVTLAALAISVGLGQRRQVRAALAAARRDTELEQARRQTVEERARIARELHDVVAHNMSIVHIQAESARFRITSVDQADREFEEIARSARTALREMRQLLNALRPDNDDRTFAPQPTIADIPALIHNTERVGNTTRFATDVEPGSANPLLELTVYRIVQEALSNVVRHAPGADVDVTLVRESDAIVVRVVNQPPRVPTAIAASRDLADHGGHGLRGMRERVALLDGRIIQQALESGGFLVEATLPSAKTEGGPAQ
jgi:signal transduction histidine kinase